MKSILVVALLVICMGITTVPAIGSTLDDIGIAPPCSNNQCEEQGDQDSMPMLLAAAEDIGQCMGACASEQGICIGGCQGSSSCISNCSAAHGRCVSRCH